MKLPPSFDSALHASQWFVSRSQIVTQGGSEDLEATRGPSYRALQVPLAREHEVSYLQPSAHVTPTTTVVRRTRNGFRAKDIEDYFNRIISNEHPTTDDALIQAAFRHAQVKRDAEQGQRG